MAKSKSTDKASQTPPAAAARKPAKSNLVTVVKDGEKIKISPLTVQNHLQLGWKLVDAAVVAAAEDETPVDPAAETPAENPDGDE